MRNSSYVPRYEISSSRYSTREFNTGAYPFMVAIIIIIIIMLMFHEESPFLSIDPGEPMKMINFVVLIRACGAIEPCFFVAYFLSCFLQQYHLFTLPR